MKIKKVFISYSQDSEEQIKKVALFANQLRNLSIDANINQFFVSTEEGWPLWLQNQIDKLILLFNFYGGAALKASIVDAGNELR